MKRLPLLPALALVLIFALGLTFGLVACATSTDSAEATPEATEQTGEVVSPELQAIKDRGTLRVGVKSDVPGLGLLNTTTGQYEGLEIELAHLLAQRIIGDPAAVEFTAVTADTRGKLLDEGQLDMVIATFTIREERKAYWNFSQPYFTDSVGLLVYQDSGLETLADFDGRTIAVTTGSTTQEAIEQQIADKGYDISVNFREFPTNQDCVTSLSQNEVDAFSVDKAILAGFDNDSRVILPDSFNPQEYGIATRLSSPDLTTFVNNFIIEAIADGTISTLIVENGLAE